MEFTVICLVLAAVALVLCIICGRAADPVLAIPMFFAFLVLLVTAILAECFGNGVGIAVGVFLTLALLTSFFGTD